MEPTHDRAPLVDAHIAATRAEIATEEAIAQALRDHADSHQRRAELLTSQLSALQELINSRHTDSAVAAARMCRDGGTCHHSCAGPCFREESCGPLSGVFPGDQWPPQPTTERLLGTCAVGSGACVGPHPFTEHCIRWHLAPRPEGASQ